MSYQIFFLGNDVFLFLILVLNIPEVLNVLKKMEDIKRQMRESGFGDDSSSDEEFDINNFK